MTAAEFITSTTSLPIFDLSKPESAVSVRKFFDIRQIMRRFIRPFSCALLLARFSNALSQPFLSYLLTELLIFL